MAKYTSIDGLDIARKRFEPDDMTRGELRRFAQHSLALAEEVKAELELDDDDVEELLVEALGEDDLEQFDEEVDGGVEVDEEFEDED